MRAALLTWALLLTASGIPAATRAGAPDRDKGARADLHGDPLPPGALARLGTVRWRTGAEIQSLEYAPDGKTLAALSGGRVYLFDAATGKVNKIFRPANATIERVAFSPDGKRLAWSGWVREGGRAKYVVQVWGLAAARKTLEADGKNVLWLGWSAEGEPLALSRGAGFLALRELAGGKEKRFLAPDIANLSASLKPYAYSARRAILATSEIAGAIHVWDAATGEKKFTRESKDGFAYDLAISADGRTLAALTRKGVRLWDAVAGKPLALVDTDQKYRSVCVFAPDGKTLVTISRSDEARFWDVATGKERGRTKGKRTFGEAAAFAPDGKTLATVEAHGGTVHLWDVATGALKQEPAGHASPPLPAVFSPDGRQVATGSMDGTVFVWDPASGRQLAQVRRPYGWSRGYAFSTDGRSLYSFWTGDKLYVHDASTGRELHTLAVEDPDRPNTRQSGWRLELSRDRKTLVAFSYYYAKKPGERVAHELLVTGWDAATRKQLFRRSRPHYSLGSAVSLDLRMFAVSQDGSNEPYPEGGSATGPMRLEDLVTGAHLLSFPPFKGQMWPLAFSPDGRLLASVHSGPDPGVRPPAVPAQKLRLWEVATATEILELPVSFNARVAFSPDGRLLAVSAPGPEIVLWDLRRGREQQRFKGFDARVTGLAFAPDGRRLVSGLGDTTSLVWEVAAESKAEKPGGLDGAGVARAWADLGTDARKAFAARSALAASPAQAIPFLKDHLAPAQPADPQRLRRLLADLNSRRFNEREAARKGLEDLGDLATGALRRALTEKSSLEARRRIEVLLEKLRVPITRPELLRVVRAVAVLEDIANLGAREILAALSRGAPDARLTHEATAALERLTAPHSAAP